MDHDFLRPPHGADFIANPFAQTSVPGGAAVTPEVLAGTPSSGFDVASLLGGDADPAASQTEIQITPGPLNLETAVTELAQGDLAGVEADVHAADDRADLPSAEDIGNTLEALLAFAAEHVADRAALCRELGNLIAGMQSDHDSSATPTGGGQS